MKNKEHILHIIVLIEIIVMILINMTSSFSPLTVIVALDDAYLALDNGNDAPNGS